MGILLFVLKYMYISLLLKIINGFSRPAKIMASPFKAEDFTSLLPGGRKKETVKKSGKIEV